METLLANSRIKVARHVLLVVKDLTFVSQTFVAVSCNSIVVAIAIVHNCNNIIIIILSRFIMWKLTHYTPSLYNVILCNNKSKAMQTKLCVWHDITATAFGCYSILLKRFSSLSTLL